MDLGEWSIRWSVRLALAGYFVALMLRLHGCRPSVWSRRLWTIGFVAFLVHVVAAFHFVHEWSHAKAYAATARRTLDAVGVEWGGGLYFNYVFLCVWLADTAFWWSMGRDRYERRSTWVEATIQAFLAFMAFNAAVVFAQGATRWLAAAATILILGGLVKHFRIRRLNDC